MGRSWSYAIPMALAIMLGFIPRGNVQQGPAPYHQAPRPSPVATPVPPTLDQAIAARSVPSKISRETECLAKTIYFEARGEVIEGQMAVAHTVINRTRSGKFPDTICAVVRQPEQFSFMLGGSFPEVDRESNAWRKAVAIALIAREGWPGRASRALFFHARSVSPGWRRPAIGRIGAHIFYL